MATYNTNQFKTGLKILLDGQPYSIIQNEFYKPGKGQALYRVKMRNLMNGRVLDKSFKSGDSVEAADVLEKPMQYLYNDGTSWHFMNEETYEQVEAGEAAMAEAKDWILPEKTCQVTLWNGQPITVTPPIFAFLKVTETDPGLRGDTSGGGSKPATLETGAVIRVPLFINEGDTLKVDTRTGDYVSRGK